MEQILEVFRNKSHRAQANRLGENIDLRTLVLAGLGSLVAEPDENHQRELRFEESLLLDFKRQRPEHLSLHQCLQYYLEAPCESDSKVLQLAQYYQLCNEELLALRLCIAVEEDPLIAPCLAYLQNNTRSTRPTIGLLQKVLSLFAPEAVAPLIPAILAGGNALKTEVLVLHNKDEPLINQSLAVTVPLVLALRDQQANFTHATHIANLDEFCLTEGMRETAMSHALSLESEDDAVLKIRCGFSLERKQVAVFIAKSMQCTALKIATDNSLPVGLGPYCLLAKCLPVFEYHLGPNERQTLPDIKGYNGPLICLLGFDGDIETNSTSVLEWHLEVPSANERCDVWKNFVDEELAQELSVRFIQGTGRIAQLSAVALRQARRFERDPQMEDIYNAAWNAENGGLDSLAQPIYEQIQEEGLVLTQPLRRQMHSLYLRCLGRESLDEDLGISIKQRYHCGVKALMVGPSGTGKTLSAAWLATRLGLPLFRVDIASIVSKYIGETEKNLSTLMDKAEHSDVVLLFDEADALFGKRTDVKDSSDRFANSQTNYLLQRIENYRGIVLLTSNSRSRIDQAFLRRIDYIIEFSNPSAEERRLLWRVHLGDKHAVAARDVNKIAVKCDLGGGHIRNAVLTAAVHAKEANCRIRYEDLLEGIACEYRKLGKQPPLALS